MKVTISIEPADLGDLEFADFLRAHLRDLAPTAPPESRHALDLDGLRAAGVRVWIARVQGRIVGTVAIAPVETGHVELKSMRTDPGWRGRGIASSLLMHAMVEARRAGASRMSLETGSMDFFEPARLLYARHGFAVTAPFGRYRPDPNSVFMSRRIS